MKDLIRDNNLEKLSVFSYSGLMENKPSEDESLITSDLIAADKKPQLRISKPNRLSTIFSEQNNTAKYKETVVKKLCEVTISFMKEFRKKKASLPPIIRFFLS